MRLLKTLFIYALFLSLFIYCTAVVFAQNENDEALFRRGAILFKQGKYISASLDFKEIINNYDSGSWTVPAYMMLSKTYFQLGEYEESIATALTLRSSYPENPYTEWTHYITAACKFNMGEFNQAVSDLSELATKTNDRELRQRSLSAIRFTILPVAGRDAVYATLLEKGIDPSDLESVQRYDSPLDYEITAYDEEDSGLMPRKDAWRQSSALKIGLLAPLTGSNSDLGQQLLAGVQTAFQKNKLQTGTEVELLVEDTGSDKVAAVLKTRKLIADGVIAIIGPVLSESTVPAAVESQSYGIPFISPTATDVGLTRLGRFIFQLNINPIVQAEALTKFAIEKLNVSNYVVIADNDLWGQSVARTVEREMMLRGINNVWTGYFSPDIPDSADNLFLNIRENAPNSFAMPDSIVVVHYGNAFADTLVIKKDILLRGDEKFEPLYSIDCIIFSVVSEHAVQLASKILEYNINTAILGDTGWWSNERVFIGGEQYIEGAYVVAPAGELSDGLGSNYFSGSPGFFPADSIPLMKGADAVNLLMYCFQKGATDTEAILEILCSIKDFQGVSTRITIDPKRHTNNAVNFINIQNGNYVKANDIIMSNREDTTTGGTIRPFESAVPINP